VDRLFRLKRTSPQEEYEQAAICQDDVDMLQRNRYLDPECKVPDPPANCAAVSKAAAMHHSIPEDVHAREEYFPQPRRCCSSWRSLSPRTPWHVHPQYKLYRMWGSNGGEHSAQACLRS
jgi:hypothetical protein